MAAREVQADDEGSAAAAASTLASSSSSSSSTGARQQTRAAAHARAAGESVGADLLAVAVAATAASEDIHDDDAGDDIHGDDDTGVGDEDYVPDGSINRAPSAAPSKGRAPFVTRLAVLVEVPEMEQRVFDSWEHFHEYLLDYGQRTSQLYSVRSATPSSRRNNLVCKKKAPPLQKLIPEQFVHYVKTITCTHGGKPRPRSTGLRPNHQHRAIECPAQINACVKRDRDEDGGAWRVHVTNQHAWHNHEVSAAVYSAYPEVRNALGADVLATVNILRKAEAKRKKILEYIVENTPKKPRMKDLHNLLSKMKRDDDGVAL